MGSDCANYRPSNMFAELAPRLRAISQANCRSQLHIAVAAAVLFVGCDHYVFASAVPLDQDAPFVPTLYTFPENVVQEMLDRGCYRANPVISRLRETQAPVSVVFCDKHPSPTLAEVGRILSSQGMVGGALVPVLSATEDMSVFGVYSRTGIPGSAIINCVKVIGAATSLRLLELYDVVEPPVLTDTQATILQWAAAGKSTSDIAMITGLTARNCEYHLGQIYKRLGVTTRSQAVIALAEGRVQMPISAAALEK